MRALRPFVLRVLFATGLTAACAIDGSLRVAHAEESAPAPAVAPAATDIRSLLGRLARHAEQFEEMKRRGSFTLNGRMEELDGDGKVKGTKEMVVRVTATPPSNRRAEIMRFVEDGEDKTAEAREKAAKSQASGRKKKERTLKLPFLASEQPRYDFAIVETDRTTPTRMRVTFTPRTSGEDVYKGSAWVDATSGEILTMGFSPTKNPTFVDHIDITVRFDLATPLGRAPSSIQFDARGGLLFIKKRFRGSATISDPKLA